MKGKIYKNKLNSTSTKQHLHTDISSISPPLHPTYLQPSSPGSHLFSPKNKNQIMRESNIAMINRNSNNNNNNNGKKSFIHELFAETTANNHNNRGMSNYGNQQQVNSFIDQFNQQQQNSNFITHASSPHHQQSLLKRVVSNPNLTSCQFLVPQNKEDDIDAIDEASILDKSSHNNSFLNNHLHQNTSKLTQKGLKHNNYPAFIDPTTQTRPLSHFASAYNSPIHQLPQNPLLQASNLMYFPPQNFHLKPTSQTDYITAYQKRHKQRISALESQHELQIQFYEEELKTKEQTIEEMRKLLKEKEDVIKRLQSENANLSNRSYVSFSNGGNHHYASKE